jgi:hypothetical protein
MTTHDGGLERFGQVLIVLAVLVAWGSQVLYVLDLGDRLSPFTAFSEANALRAGEGYVVQGFTSHAGLPVVSYGDQFPRVGRFAGRKAWVDVYTHYPPAPDLMAGVLTLVFGKGNIVLFRTLPLAVGLACVGFFAWAMGQILGYARGALLVIGCAIVPMFSNMMHTLHYHGYAFGLFLVELAALGLFLRPGTKELGRWWAALFAIGFVQGWFSFDYSFIVALAPVPFGILWSGQTPGQTAARTLRAVVLLGSGFALAHLLHFMQVALYFGSLGTALADFTGTAQYRFSGATGRGNEPTHLSLLTVYLTELVHRWRYFGWFFSFALATFVFALLANTGRIARSSAPRIEITWRLDRTRALLGLLSALAASSLWVLIMWNHAWWHRHFLPRLFFLVYFFCLFAVLDSMRIRAPAEERRP